MFFFFSKRISPPPYIITMNIRHTWSLMCAIMPRQMTVCIAKCKSPHSHHIHICMVKKLPPQNGFYKFSPVSCGDRKGGRTEEKEWRRNIKLYESYWYNWTRANLLHRLLEQQQQKNTYHNANNNKKQYLEVCTLSGKFPFTLTTNQTPHRFIYFIKIDSALDIIIETTKFVCGNIVLVHGFFTELNIPYVAHIENHCFHFYFIRRLFGLSFSRLCFFPFLTLSPSLRRLSCSICAFCVWVSLDIGIHRCIIPIHSTKQCTENIDKINPEYDRKFNLDSE